MSITSLKINCRIEELPVLGGFLLSSMEENLADFTAFSPAYDAAYITASRTEMSIIEGLINPKKLNAELKVITARMYGSVSQLRGKIDYLEGYINRATGLTVAAKDFGISVLRKKVNNGDVEGLLAAFAYVESHVDDNMAALTAVGYTAGQHTALKDLIDSVKADNIAQNDKMNERNNLVIANYGKLNVFWNRIVDISDAGKRIYKTVAPNKVDDFTMSKLKERVRQERSNTKIMGTVMSGGLPINGAKVELLPLVNGRRRTAKSNSTGYYEILSITPGEYEVIVSAKGKMPLMGTVLIETNAPLTKDYVLV